LRLSDPSPPARTMFSRDFLELLEYRLTKALAESADPDLRQYWCDGVLELEWADEYQPSHVARTRRVILRAWMEGVRSQKASAGQQLHPLYLVLGPASLQAYVNGQELWPWIEAGIEPEAVGWEATGKSLAFVIHLL
jgi:hypothetical protein